MRVFVAGATGVIGRPLVRQLGLEGHDVSVMTRSQASAEHFRQQGHEALVCDVFDREGLLRALAAARPDAVIHQMTSIPRRMNPKRVNRDMAETNRLRTEGTQNLVDAAREAGVTRLLAQSIAFAYTPRGDGPATEEEPLFLDAPDAFAPLVHAIQACEETTLAPADIEGIVLRYGFFYGPGTIYAAGGSFAQDVKRRRVPIVGSGSGTFSFVHVEDAATATVLALENGPPGVYNVVDSDPAPVGTWLPLYAEWLDAPRPLHVPRWVARLGAGDYGIYLMQEQRGAIGKRAFTELGWKPSFGSWRDGFQAEFRDSVSASSSN